MDRLIGSEGNEGNLFGELTGKESLSGEVGYGLNGPKYHPALLLRDYPDQHPIEAISGLRDELDSIWQRPTVEKLGSYLYKLTYSEMPPEVETDMVIGGCSSYVKDGKLHRNFDWDYDESLSFEINCPDYTGIAFGSFNDLMALPYRVVDGVNKHGIMVSTHVLYNDWEWHGEGDIPLYKIPYLALTTMTSIEDIFNLPLDNLKNTPMLEANEYLGQFMVTDGTTTYVIMPSTEDNTYAIADATDNPKMTNFRWVSDFYVDRHNLQRRPTGVERYNMMPCELKDLRFTIAYESAQRLSEFIGLRGTSKDSTDDELREIFETAHDIYIHRERDGQTWQTMHSVVYSKDGIEELYVQEDWDDNYISNVTKEYVDKEISKVNEELSKKPNIRIETTEYWDAHPEFIGEKGDIIVYSDYSTVGETVIPNFKISDGMAYIGAQPFVGDDVRDYLQAHIMNTEIHITNEERAFWNNKVSILQDPLDTENLIFTTD